MLNSEVEATDGPIKVDRDRVAGAAVEIRVAAFTLHVQIRYTFEAGRYVAGAFLTMSPDDVTPDDVESVAGELANVIGGRLHTQYSKSAPDSDMSLPTLRTADAGAASEAPDHNSTICLTFNEVYSPLAFEVRVRVEHAPTVTLMEPGDSEGAFASVRTAG
jgi:CheY-specific phosphatase CheX